jgi:hypothetical protein
VTEEGYVKLENYSLDGAEVEASADKYEAVWAEKARRHKGHLPEKVIADAGVCTGQRESPHIGEPHIVEVES